MRGLIAYSEIFLFSNIRWLLLILLSDTARTHWRDIVDASCVQGEELLDLWGQDFVPELLIFVQEIGLGSFYQLYLTTPQITYIKSLVFSQRLKLTFFNYINLIFRNEIDRPLDYPFLASLILLVSPFIKIWNFCSQKQRLFLMNDHDVANPVNHSLPWL